MAINEIPESTPAVPTNLTELAELNPAAPSNLTEVAESTPEVPSSLTELSESKPAVPSDLTEIAESTPAVPTNLTEESEATPAAPNDLAEVAESTPAVPTNLTELAESTPAAPSNLTELSESTPAVPSNLTEIAESNPAAPSNLTEVAESAPAAPVNLTLTDAPALPRTLTPRFNLNFGANSYELNGVAKAVDDIVTYSRASSATYYERFINQFNQYDYRLVTDYVGDVENLVTYSEQFDNAAWSKTNSSVTANNGVSPFGDRTAEKVTKTTGNENDRVVQTITISNSTDHNVSCYFKKAGFNGMEPAISVRVSGGTLNRMVFAIDSGVVLLEQGSVNNSKIDYIGDGWYRASFSFLSDGTSMDLELDIDRSSTTTDLNSLLIWGAQLTESAKPLPYVKTLGSAVTETFTASPRLEYDPATGESLGYLAEGASTNLIFRSEEFDNAAWGKVNATVLANEDKAPDGTESGDAFSANSTASINPFVQQAVTVTATTIYTFSLYAKRREVEFIQIRFGTGNVTGDPRANFDLTSGVLGSVDSEITAEIREIGDYYRISATVETVGTSLTCIVNLIQSSTDTRNQINAWGVGQGLYIWGAQLEEKPFATSYIRTEGSAVSRAADDMAISASSALSELPLSIFSKINIKNYPSGGSGSNRFLFLANGLNSSQAFLRVSSNGDISAKLGTATLTPAEFLSFNQENANFAFVAINQSSGNLYLQGGDSPFLSVLNWTLDPSVDFDIGGVNGISCLFGHIKQLTIYDTALTADEVSLL